MAKAKPAEAQRKAISEAQKIVAIWSARQAGGRALWFHPTIGAAIAAGLHWFMFSCPAVRPVRLGGPAHARPAPRRRDFEPDPIVFVTALSAQCSVRELEMHGRVALIVR
jgi:hypothetical protein